MNIEGLGVLYLGRELTDEWQPLLLDSNQLVTHAFIAGMTGSGKTGLGVVMLEELALDGVPSIVIDVKGDLTNLALTFPGLTSGEFAPFVPDNQNADAIAKQAVDAMAASKQDPARIQRFADSIERVIFTPGSDAGRRLALLASLSAPNATDDRAREEAASMATLSLAALTGLTQLEVGEPAHAFTVSILCEAWKAGRAVDPGSLLRDLQNPPFKQLGLMDVDTVLPPKERIAIAVKLNTAFASPSVAGFMQGEPLDVPSLLRSPSGKPRMSIISLRHLSDEQRMFAVTIILSRVLEWTRVQSGTTSLRAAIYMDEVFGFFPPVANPPSKEPMLRLLKQARAFGVGVILATQNPVDLDYKGLANTGTWFLGRMQTERDRERLLAGVTEASGHDSRAALDAKLATLPKRSFVMHDARGDATFETRWALSYLRGPLDDALLRKIQLPAASPAASAGLSSSSQTGRRPVLPSGIAERFFVRTDLGPQWQYSPGILARARLHYVDAKLDLDQWLAPSFVFPLSRLGLEFSKAWFLGYEPPAFALEPIVEHEFAVPAVPITGDALRKWSEEIELQLYSNWPLRLQSIRDLGIAATAGESAASFQGRVAQAARVARDEALAELEKKYAPKLQRLHRKTEEAQEKLEHQHSIEQRRNLSTALDIGGTLLGAVLGSRRSIASAASRAIRSSTKSVGAQSAEARLSSTQAEAQELDAQYRTECDALAKRYAVENIAIDYVDVAPRKGDIVVEEVSVLWVPVPLP